MNTKILLTNPEIYNKMRLLSNRYRFKIIEITKEKLEKAKNDYEKAKKEYDDLIKSHSKEKGGLSKFV